MRVVMRRVLIVFAVLAALLTAAFLLGPRVEVGPPEPHGPVPSLEALDDWLAAEEARFDDITPGAERKIVWADATRKTRTPLALVYLHGFSASRPEVAPLCDDVARALGANLYYARLRGHGRPGAALGEVTVAQWLADALEALDIADRLGERVVLIGTSTGGTLATWLAARPEARGRIEAMVLISPNFGPRDGRSRALTWPWGLQLAEASLGAERSWEPANPQMARYWTTRYPVRALLPMMALVELVEDLPPEAVDVRTLVIYSPHDTVLDTAPIAAWAAASDRRTALVVDDAIEHANHVLAGDILAPSRTARLAAAIVDFVRGVAPAG